MAATSNPTAAKDLGSRVLVLAPVGRDGALARDVLEHHGIAACRCADPTALVEELTRGAGVLLLAEEALGPACMTMLLPALAAQPAWSDVPLVMIAKPSSTSTAEGTLENVERLGHVTVLDRPIRVVSLVSAIRVALRARHRQYEARDMLARLEDGVVQRDRFLAMLGHELRNPLAAIVLGVELLPMGPDKHAREVIERQARHLTRLVDELLDVSRVTSGKLVLQRVVVDLRVLVERSVAALRPGMKDVALETSLGEPPLHVYADPVRMEQVITNLLTNAVKYTPSGGRVAVSTRRCPSRGAEGESIALCVQDDGVGIPPEMLPRVFDLFTQVDSSLARARGGLGIGLTIVRTVVELHGGRVTATSEGLGRGTRVDLVLPASASAPATIADESAVESEPGSPAGPRRVLIVEDDDDIRESLCELLVAGGFQVEAAAEGAKAVEIASTRPPEIALVDIGLPGMNGYEVARAIRRDLGERILLAAVTGYGQPEDRERARDAGFDTHFTKPVDIAKVRRFLREARTATH